MRFTCRFRERPLASILFLSVVLTLTSGGLAPIQAGEDSDVAELRAELARMRDEYESRIEALERRVDRTENRALAGEPIAAAPQSRANAFNPSFSAILQGRYAAISGEDGHRNIPGFLIGTETGRGPEGFSLGESEFVFSANIDDQFYGFVNFALNQEDGDTEIELEEAYLQTLALPTGFTVKAGQFFSAIGYQNQRHSHTWDFVDQPLAYEAMLGTQLLDTGLQVSWLAPMDTYLELGGELLSGEGFPGGGRAHGGVGTRSVFARLGGDVGTSHSWKAGLAYLSSDPRERVSEGPGSDLLFTGDSDLVVADLVWKWAPDGNFRERNLVFQTEYLMRRERGQLELRDGSEGGSYRGRGHGFYAQAVYQFMPRWRVGLRYGQLFSANQTSGLSPETFEGDNPSPWRASVMIDFSNSEFSRLRLQYSHEGGGLGNDDLLLLQYIVSIGSHGAHAF